MTSSKDTNRKQLRTWYAKWCGSISILLAIGIRGSELSPELDVILSMLGTVCWLYVAISWKDRAMMVMNVAAVCFLLPRTIQIIASFFV